jgi:hypothetical protein
MGYQKLVNGMIREGITEQDGRTAVPEFRKKKGIGKGTVSVG